MAGSYHWSRAPGSYLSFLPIEQLPGASGYRTWEVPMCLFVDPPNMGPEPSGPRRDLLEAIAAILVLILLIQLLA
jgi:hypothetical protein